MEYLYVCVYYFFFQAEDGIRDFHVTGVQTCALPISTAATLPVARPPCVVKADGLAAGKGVHVCRTDAELDAALRATAAIGGPVVIEELLAGEEVSLFAITDGTRTIALPAAQDFKRVGDGDT